MPERWFVRSIAVTLVAIVLSGCEKDPVGPSGGSAATGVTTNAVPASIAPSTAAVPAPPVPEPTVPEPTVPETTVPPAPAPPRTPPATAPRTTVPPAPVLPAGPSGPKCVVWLHGKGGNAQAATTVGDRTDLRPGGNASGWGGRQWLYYPDSGFAQVRSIVAAAIDGAGCGRVIVAGFSNGASAAASLYCRGETFGGRAVGYVVDDPVTDASSQGCRPAAGVKVQLVWTGALEGQAQPGWSCASADWTCQGGTTLGIAAYQAALGAAYARSPNWGRHSPDPAPAALRTWW